MLTFKIENEEVENKLVYIKKDPLKYLHKIEREYDDEDLSDVKPFGHIADSAKYIHDLRRQSNR